MSDSRSPTAGVPQVNPWLMAVAVMFATFMEVLDTTVVNVSLPHIAGSLSATIEEATWALTSYLVANADHPADDRLAGQLLRPQAPAACCRSSASPSRRFSAELRRSCRS